MALGSDKLEGDLGKYDWRARTILGCYFILFICWGSCRFGILGTDEVDVVVLVMVVLGFLIWFHSLELLLVFDPRKGVLEKGH